MRLNLFYFSFLLLMIACATNGKKQMVYNAPQEEALIRQTIQLYFDGWRTGDTTKIGTAMHTTCQLKNIHEEGIDGVKIFSRATYLGFFKPRPPRAAQTRILSIDITRDIASAKCQIELPNRLYTDYFNMMKVDGQWYIVDKAATSWAINEEN